MAAMFHRSDVTLVKRYADRRFYNTVTSTYVSLMDMAEMVLDGRRFKVLDADTGQDITREILNQLH